MSQRTLKFVIHKRTPQKQFENGVRTLPTYFWSTIVASNGRVLFTSEMYKTKKAAEKACRIVGAEPFIPIIDTTIKK